MASASKRKEGEVVKWGSWWGKWENLLELPPFALLVVEIFNSFMFFFLF